MKDNDLLISRLAFRCNQRSKNNKGTISDIHRILQNELDMTAQELKEFDLSLLISDGLRSDVEKIKNSLDGFHAKRRNQIRG